MYIQNFNQTKPKVLTCSKEMNRTVEMKSCSKNQIHIFTALQSNQTKGSYIHHLQSPNQTKPNQTKPNQTTPHQRNEPYSGNEIVQ